MTQVFPGILQLARTHDQLYSLLTIVRCASGICCAAIEEAFRLRPDSGEAHLARAEDLFRGYRDFDGALAELETAAELPNDARLFELKGYVERARALGRVHTRLEKAVELDQQQLLATRIGLVMPTFAATPTKRPC